MPEIILGAFLAVMAVLFLRVVLPLLLLGSLLGNLLQPFAMVGAAAGSSVYEDGLSEEMEAWLFDPNGLEAEPEEEEWSDWPDSWMLRYLDWDWRRESSAEVGEDAAVGTGWIGRLLHEIPSVGLLIREQMQEIWNGLWQSGGAESAPSVQETPSPVPVREPEPQEEAQAEPGVHLSAEDLTWIEEPTYEYEDLQPVPVSIDWTGMKDTQGYSTAPDYYIMGKADDWHFIHMPDQEVLEGYRFYMPANEGSGERLSCSIRATPRVTLDESNPWWEAIEEIRNKGAYWAVIIQAAAEFYNQNYVEDSATGIIYMNASGSWSGEMFESIEEYPLIKPVPIFRWDLTGMSMDKCYIGNGENGLIDWDSESTIAAPDLSALAYISPQGELITGYEYDQAQMFSYGIAACRKNGKWGYIDEQGNEVTDFVYDAPWALRGSGGAWDGYSDYEEAKKQDSELSRDAAFPCTSDTMVVSKDGQIGLLYRDGSVLIAFGEFEDLAPAYRDMLWAKQDGKWGILDLAAAKMKAGLPQSDYSELEQIEQFREEESRSMASLSIQRVDRSQYFDDGAMAAEIYCDQVVLKETREAEKKINQSTAAFCEDYLTESVETMADLLSVEDLNRDLTPFYRKAEVTVTQNDNGYLSLCHRGLSYYGGTGNEMLYPQTFDLATGEEVTIAQIWGMSEADTLNSLQEQCIRYINEHPTIMWMGIGANPAGMAIDAIREKALSDYKFYLEWDEVVLCFDQYELAAGAEGAVKIPVKKP